MSAGRGTPEGDRLDVLVTLTEAYEARHFPLDLPDAVAAIEFVREQRNLTARHLCRTSGRPRRLRSAEPKRPLTLAMIRRLHEGLGIPAESLIRQSA